MPDDVVKPSKLDEIHDRHMSLLTEVGLAHDSPMRGPQHAKTHDLIERESQTKLLAAMLELMWAHRPDR